MRRSLLLALLLAVAGCHANTRDTGAPTYAFTGIDGERFGWLEAECNDTELDLAQHGFERELRVRIDGGSLLLTFDTTLATRGCTATAVWAAKPADNPSSWRFEPQANVVLPVGADCGAVETAPVLGSLRVYADTLELVTHDSPWCRGFDARFVFERIEPKQLSPSQIVMHYAAAFNRRDAQSIAMLFDDNGSLIEPFTRTDDGNYKRHEGRAAVRSWYGAALGQAPWVALRLLALEPAPGAVSGTSQWIAPWEYMDASLAEPLRGRNLFVVAGGEIYETELQLLSDPKPIAENAAPRQRVGDAP